MFSVEEWAAIQFIENHPPATTLNQAIRVSLGLEAVAPPPPKKPRAKNTSGELTLYDRVLRVLSKGLGPKQMAVFEATHTDRVRFSNFAAISKAVKHYERISGQHFVVRKDQAKDKICIKRNPADMIPVKKELLDGLE